MNKLSEEIIKNANEMIYNAECWIDDEEYTGAEEREWAEFEKKTIKGLLDLYNKEKEKNKKLEDELMEKELIIDGMKEDRRIAIEEIQEHYFISKNKIREKIEEKLNCYKSYEGLEIYKKDNYKEIVILLEQLKQEILEESEENNYEI